MTYHASLYKLKYLIPAVLVSLVAACMLCMTMNSSAFADTGSIHDNSHVLDSAKVNETLSQLSKPADVYTTNTFTGDNDTFDQQTQAMADKTPDRIIISIDTLHRHLAIFGGASVGLGRSQYDDAISAFKSNMSSNNYTDATVAALQSLQSSLQGGTSSSSSSTSDSSSAASSDNSYAGSSDASTGVPEAGSNIGSWIFLPFLCLALPFILLFIFIAKAGGFVGRRSWGGSTYYGRRRYNDWNNSNSSWGGSSRDFGGSSWGGSSGDFGGSSWGGSSGDFGGGSSGSSGNF